MIKRRLVLDEDLEKEYSQIDLENDAYKQEDYLSGRLLRIADEIGRFDEAVEFMTKKRLVTELKAIIEKYEIEYANQIRQKYLRELSER